MKVSYLLKACSVLFSNCYGIQGDKAAVVIDPGKYDEKIVEFLNSNKDKQRLILITHAHHDHIAGAKQISEETGVKIAIGEEEAESLHTLKYNLSERFRNPITDLYADITFTNNQVYSLGDLNIKTIFTPGHTKGGVCYLINGSLFSGDTLFYETIGRTDLPGGSSEEILKSLQKLLNTLPDETMVYTGHGGETTIGHERTFNPFAV